MQDFWQHDDNGKVVGLKKTEFMEAFALISEKAAWDWLYSTDPTPDQIAAFRKSSFIFKLMKNEKRSQVR
jgi:hypothetical protein